jgi:hypothetical protein
MKRICLIGLAIIATGVISGTAAAPSMAICAQVSILGEGNQIRRCTSGVVGGNYIKIVANPKRIGKTNDYCAETETAGDGRFKENTCLMEMIGGKFIKVIKGMPLFYRRRNSKEGEGGPIAEGSLEPFSGGGSEQILNGTVAGTEIEITAKSVQTKGVLYNSAFQGQIKELLIYHEPRLLKPELKGCEVKIGTNNEASAEGHLAWKYKGESEELAEEPVSKQKPGIIFTPIEIEEGVNELPKGTVTMITLSGSGCGILAGKFEIKESQSVIPKPENVEEWTTTLTMTSPGWKQQHFWNGKEIIGVSSIGLTFGNNPATFKGEIKANTAAEEIAIFEK